MTSNIIKDKGGSGDLPNKKNKAGGFLNKETYCLSPTISNVRLLDWEKEFEKICYEIDVGDGDFLYQRKSDVNKIKSIIKKVRQQAVNEEREICKEKMAQSNEWWNQKLKSVKQLSITETIEKVEEMMIDEVRPERGSDEWLSSDVRNQFRAKLRHQLSQLKIRKEK